MIKLAIFDLDGTLLNTIADLGESTNHALRTLGFPIHTLDKYNFFVGNGIDVLFERALPEGAKTKENVAAMRNEFIAYYQANITNKTTIYEGINELLNYVHESGIALAVASNKYQAGTTALVDHFFGQFPFVAVLGQRAGIPTKPNPQIIDDVLSVHSVQRDEVLYIGDSGVDMQTAKNAQLISCGVTWGFRPLDELQQFDPMHIVNHPSEIVDVIKQYND